jgi:FtsP/CotA-like multicopper oxidase with cupredoxin domain
MWGLLQLLVISVLFFMNWAEAKTVRYELVATRGEVNLSGKKTVGFALMLNGQVPAPKLEFTEGDEAEIVLKNRIPNEEVSIHWHGILLPPEMDGVPYVNTPPIKSGEQFTYRFKVRQNGTYWYHSHTNVQEQKGLYGAIVIHPSQKTVPYDKDVVVVLSDWSDENATDILKNLRKDGDYYLYKKGTMRSWWGAIQAHSLGNFLNNEWTRMGGMDFSDVGYDAFLINGKRELQLATPTPGEKVRLRIINASASTYFNVSLGQEDMNVISADGVDIEPIRAKEFLIGMAETYDVLFEVPDNKSYELRATAQDGTGVASGWIGVGEKVQAPVKAFPDMYATMSHGDHDGHSEHGHGSSHGNHRGTDSKSVQTLTVGQIKSLQKTEFPKDVSVHDVKLELDGDMSRYIWFINGKAIHEERTIEIKEGEIVRFTFVNKTMMHHPMHLHGHFFRVLNKYQAYSPLKHTVDVSPHTTRVIEFIANEPGEWMLHCHNLYHLKTGMARVVKYSTFTASREMAQYQKHDPHLHDHWYFYGMTEAATNHAQATFRLSQTWNQFEARIETRNTAGKNFSFGEPWEVEGDLFYRRWFNRFFNLALGGTVFDKNASAVVGVGYILPFLVRSGVYINQLGKIRLDLDKRFQWAKTIFTDVDFTWRPGQADDLGENAEFEISLMYSPSWSWAAGLMLTNRNIGLGAQIQF